MMCFWNEGSFLSWKTVCIMQNVFRHAWGSSHCWCLQQRQGVCRAFLVLSAPQHFLMVWFEEAVVYEYTVTSVWFAVDDFQAKQRKHYSTSDPLLTRRRKDSGKQKCWMNYFQVISSIKNERELFFICLHQKLWCFSSGKMFFFPYFFINPLKGTLPFNVTYSMHAKPLFWKTT